jgi:hypothetical protein
MTVNDGIRNDVVYYKDFNSNELCSICREPASANSVAHTGGKDQELQHSVHRACIEPWLELHKTCPLCRRTIGFSWTERCVKEMKLIAKDASLRMLAMAAGVVARASVAAVVSVAEEDTGAAIAIAIASIAAGAIGLAVAAGEERAQLLGLYVILEGVVAGKEISLSARLGLAVIPAAAESVARMLNRN